MKKEHNRYREEEALEKEKSDNEEIIKEQVEETTDDGELEKIKSQYLRTLADFENFKKRTNEERIKERKYAHQSLFEQMITVLDIFDKAVNTNTEDNTLKNYLYGFKMINDNLKQILESEGVKKIVSLGTSFDPKYHHAIETDWDETKDENIVTAEMQTGYMYKDRLLRPSLVKVNQKTKGNEENE